jgi:hypothetical protein
MVSDVESTAIQELEKDRFIELPGAMPIGIG